MSDTVQEISEDALKLLVAEHGVRGTARLLQMDATQTDAFRQRVTRAKWMQEPAIVALRAKAEPALRAAPIVARMSPAQAVASELQALGSRTRISIARGIAKAGEHVESLAGAEILAQSADVKSIAQTADLVHGWKENTAQVKIRLDVLSGSQEAQAVEIEATSEPIVSSWGQTESVDPLDGY